MNQVDDVKKEKQEEDLGTETAEAAQNAESQAAAEKEEVTPDDNLADNENVDEKENHEEKEKTSFWSRKHSKETQKLKSQLEEADAKYKELNDRFLRLYSEFDNYKKRTNKEKLDLLETASEKVLVALLPVIDDFERAIAANEKTEDIQAVKDGFNLIYNKLQLLLKRFDVAEIDAIDKPFDTDFHEAVTHFPTDDESKKGKVIDVVEKGYQLKDKVIRFSKVVVAN